MKNNVLLILCFIFICITFFVFLAFHYEAQADTRYVKVGGTGNGASWATASGTLQAMIDLVASSGGGEVWVASGTYTPTTKIGGTGNRYRTFQMKNKVGIYGGFSDTGSPSWVERDWQIYNTVLSGDIGIQGVKSDNCYHVFYHPPGTGLKGTAILDGCTVTGGNANGSGNMQYGGGIHNSGALMGGLGSSPTIEKCTFYNNSANVGGAMYNSWQSTPAITNCTFYDNHATGFDAWGGGIHTSYTLSSTKPIITNCTFYGNSANYGGGLHNVEGTSPTITNCTFFNNLASISGGGIYNVEISDPTITNCIIWDNSPDEIYNENSDPIVDYCDVKGGYTGDGNINQNPMLVNPGSGDFHLLSTSPCIDRGTNTAPSIPTKDFEGDDRIIDGNASGTPTVDMGVDEYGVKVGVYVTLQGANRPISGWEVPLTLWFFEPGADVLSATPVYSFTGTTTMSFYAGSTRAYFQCPDPVAPGTYDITADTTTTLLNVKRLVGIW